MSQGKARDLEEGFTALEEMIVKAFLDGKSIRALSSEPLIEGNERTKFGRTAIKNILIAYSKVYPEYQASIEERLFKNKTHKKETVKLRELSEQEVKDFYGQIISGEKTLTEVAMEVGRTRDYIRSRVLEKLSDEEKTEFSDALKSNQMSGGGYDQLYLEFEALSEDEKKIIIFEKINSRRKKSDKPPYSDQFLERKLARIKKYFLVTRNEKIQDFGACLTNEEFWKMLYDTPGLLAYSMSDKIDPAMRNLDKNKNIGPERATQIIVEDASILGSSIPRTNLQIQMLVDYDLLNFFMNKPRYFRTSPELIYGLVKFAQEMQSPKEDIFLTDKQLLERYHITAESLKEMYNPQKDYGDFEYFDK